MNDRLIRRAKARALAGIAMIASAVLSALIVGDPNRTTIYRVDLSRPAAAACFAGAAILLVYVIYPRTTKETP